ncbi:uncharacterized protein LOC128170663 isoform X2 [Crassostrea angulata]|nr:uncharacterized protein LOC128170663 isoform X2 [Crassostrea angulata]XP_052692391.1 uncharacterized protein LOC128170663 isoform X2 [Crassostrea angulata]
MMMKFVLLYIVVINMVITTAAVTTNNRILLSSVLVGTALAASVSESYDFSDTELALLTTAVLVIIFPRHQPVQNSCTAPGYTDDPLFGCYRLVKGNTLVTKTEAIQGCASDGGRLQLINSEAEANALNALIQNEALNPPGTFIQGSRASISSPWVGDDGNPLPYLPSSVESGNIPIANLLYFRSDSPTAFRYVATTIAVTLTSYVCEI